MAPKDSDKAEKAERICKSKNGTLPTFRNVKSQQSFEEGLQELFGFIEDFPSSRISRWPIWLGYKKKNDEWRSLATG